MVGIFKDILHCTEFATCSIEVYYSDGHGKILYSIKYYDLKLQNTSINIVNRGKTNYIINKKAILQSKQAIC